MKRLLFSLSLALLFLSSASATDPVAKCSTCSPHASAGTTWSYYGLNGGGPGIVTMCPQDSNGRPLLTRIGDSHRSGYSVYIPPMPDLGPTAPRTLRLGWMTYMTPSPRIENNVSVYPQSR